MRLRVVKPDFYESETIGALSLWARHLLIGLFSYADDNGVQRDQAVSIASEVFRFDLAADPTDILRAIEQGLAELAASGELKRYQIDGARYLQITNWAEYQKPSRPSKPRFPNPAGVVTYDPPHKDSRDSVETPLSPHGDPTRGNGTGDGNGKYMHPVDSPATRKRPDAAYQAERRGAL
jgi:hypothetical protein